MWHSGVDQHYFMKLKTSDWYKERYEYYKEKQPGYSDTKIDQIINSFEYGMY